VSSIILVPESVQDDEMRAKKMIEKSVKELRLISLLAYYIKIRVTL
jgi:hypothetical protein